MGSTQQGLCGVGEVPVWAGSELPHPAPSGTATQSWSSVGLPDALKVNWLPPWIPPLTLVLAAEYNDFNCQIIVAYKNISSYILSAVLVQQVGVSQYLDCLFTYL